MDGAGRPIGEPDADAAAVRRCLGGDRQAFAELVERHQDRIWGLALRLCGGDRAEAEDVAQEVFVRAYLALSRFVPDRPFRPWLLRIALNVCRDRARRRRARPVQVSVGWAEAVDARAGPEETVLRAEERAAVRAAVAGLPTGQRTLVLLAYDRELPLREIAAVLGLPLTIVKNRLYRARRAIAARLREGEVESCGVPRDAAPTAHVRVR